MNELILDLCDDEIHIIYEVLLHEEKHWEYISGVDEDACYDPDPEDWQYLDSLIKLFKEKESEATQNSKRVTIRLSFAESVVLIESLNIELDRNPSESLIFISDFIKRLACEEFDYGVISTAEWRKWEMIKQSLEKKNSV